MGVRRADGAVVGGVSAEIITAAHGKERRTDSPSPIGLPVSDYRRQTAAADLQT